MGVHIAITIEYEKYVKFFINTNVGKQNDEYNKLYIVNEIHLLHQDEIILVSYSEYISTYYDIGIDYTTYSKQAKKMNMYTTKKCTKLRKISNYIYQN